MQGKELSVPPKGKMSKTRALAGRLKSALPVDGRKVTPVERTVASLKQEVHHIKLWEDVTLLF
jgi:hypothetical protein